METIMVNHRGYTLTTDKALMKPDDVYKWLSEESYWCKRMPLAIFTTSFEHSYCIGAIIDGRQVAFARLVTDYATFGYLADVYVEEGHRGNGIANKMMELLFGLGWVKGLRGVKLQTKDTHWLYRNYGFTDCKYPERIMELSRPDIYKTPAP